MTDQYIPLSQWPELAEQLALEVAASQNWPQVEWQLATYDAADRALIWAAIPSEGRSYIHALKSIHEAPQAPPQAPKTSAIPRAGSSSRATAGQRARQRRSV
jgi:hypothetical protein